MRKPAIILLLILLIFVNPISASSSDIVPIESDFFSGTTDPIPGLLGVPISSGTVAGVATDANHPGVIYLRDSTTANGGYRYGCDGTTLIRGGEYYEVIFQSVGTRPNQTARMGWSDSTAGQTLPTDGVWFNITRVGSVTNFTGNTASNNVRTQTSTAYPLSASVWYRGTIQINTTPNIVEYRLYNATNALLWTGNVSSNIPTAAGRDTSPCIIVSESTTDAAANILLLDYTKWDGTAVLSRGPTPSVEETTATPQPNTPAGIPDLPAPPMTATDIPWWILVGAGVILLLFWRLL